MNTSIIYQDGIRTGYCDLATHENVADQEIVFASNVGALLKWQKTAEKEVALAVILRANFSPLTQLLPPKSVKSP